MITENTSKSVKVSVRRVFFFVVLSVIGAGLLSTPAWAQEKIQERITGDTRDKGISVEKLDTRLPMQEERALPPPQQIPCYGNNHTTNSFNTNISMGGPLVAIAFTPSATVTISKVEVFTGESTAPIALAIWSDNGLPISKPLANLGDTGYFNLLTPVNWQGGNLLTPVTVNAGIKYWLVFDPSGGEQAPVQNGIGQQYWGSYTGTITSVAASNWFGPFSSSDHAWKFRMFCCVKPPSGMVAWYPFDESLTVQAAAELIHLNNGIHQPLLGGPTSTPAVVGNGLSFDGFDDYVQSPHQPWLNMGTGNFSIDAWIKTSGNAGVQVILDKRQSSPVRGFSLYVSNGFLGLQLADGVGVGFTNYTSTINVANGNWNFIAVTVNRTDPNGIKFYLNGVTIAPSLNPTGRTGLLNNAVPLSIGRRSFSSPGYFKGVIDELEIFNRVLTPAEISSISNAKSAGKCKCF